MENKPISSDLIRGHIDTIILYSLTDSDKHAQQISDYVDEKSNNEYQLNQATLYSSLKRLESLKYVSAYWHSAETGRRRYFKITDLGKNVIKENTENWAYSRSIIDKLIDCEPTPTNVKPEIITKIIEKPVVVYKTVNQPTPVDSITPLVQNSLKSDNSSLNTLQNETINDDNTIKPIEAQNISDKNFRTVLSDLIKSTQTVKKDVKEEIVTIDKSENVAKIQENPNENVVKFNEKIREDISTNKFNSNKIDFSDIIEKGEKEGYKVSVSTTDKNIKIGSIYVNKLRLFTSLTVFLLSLIETLFVVNLTKNYIDYKTLYILLPIGIFLIFPLICTILYFKNQSKLGSIIRKDSILSYGIILFNLILFTFVINLLFETDFTIKSNLVIYFIIPVIIYINLFIYSILKYVFSKLKSFRKHQ